MQLQFIRDLWHLHISTEMPPYALRDVEILLSVQSQTFYQASSSTSSTMFERGVAAAGRLLCVVEAAEDTISQAQEFRTVLAVPMFHEPDLDQVVPVEDASHDPHGSFSQSDLLLEIITRKAQSKERRTAKMCVELKVFEEAVYWIDKEMAQTGEEPHTHASLYSLRAHCRFKLGQNVAAVNDAKAAVALGKTTTKLDEPSGIDSTDSDSPACPPSPRPTEKKEKKNWGEKRAEAWELIKARNFQAAEAKLWAIIATHGRAREPKDATLFGDRARCRVELHKYEAAIEDACEGLVCKTSWTEGYRLLCYAFVGLKQWDKAREMCTRVLGASDERQRRLMCDRLAVFQPRINLQYLGE